jgi:hypothetical protein
MPTTSDLLLLTAVAILFLTLGYLIRKQKVIPTSAPDRLVTPDLNTLVVRGKYSVPKQDLNQVCQKIERSLNAPYGETVWYYLPSGRSAKYRRFIVSGAQPRLTDEEYMQAQVSELKGTRNGIPQEFNFLVTDEKDDNLVIEADCMPVMHLKIVQNIQHEFRENYVRDAQHQCRDLLRKQFLGTLQGKELEPTSIYSPPKRNEVRARLQQMGLQEIVEALDAADAKLHQNDPQGSLVEVRSALEKAVLQVLQRKQLPTNNSFYRNVETLQNKGYMNIWVKSLSYDPTYRYLSEVVHKKVSPSIPVARAYTGTALSVIEYLLEFM